MKYNALVLLGYSGVGKDTMANMLCKTSGCVNSKFGELPKRLACNLLTLPYSRDLVESKANRESAVAGFYGLSLMDVLTVLYKGSQDSEPMLKAIRQFTFDKIGADVPIFTDVRRQTELDAINERYQPLVIRLVRSDVGLGVNDSQLDELEADVIFYLSPGDIHKSYKRLCELLLAQGFKTLALIKPTLYLYTDYRSLELCPLPTYEPLHKLYTMCMALSADTLACQAAFAAFVRECDPSKHVLSPLTTDSKMYYVKRQHEQLLPLLQEIADILCN